MSEPAPILVVGGVYGERCLAPSRSELFGSGGRAAAVIRVLGGQASLRTYLDLDTAERFEPIAGAFGIEVSSTHRTTPVIFGYAHPLARPELVPSRHMLRVESPLQVEGDCVLRFGMVEGSGVVAARQAVYDPQDLELPESFRANGSKAQRLAVIANQTEIRMMLGAAIQRDTPIETLASTLAAQEGAEVVIVKQGPAGALVWDQGKVSRVPAFGTKTVWKIGSGDTFSGAFSHYWMQDQQSAHEAAYKASLASAHYCNGGAIDNLMAVSEFEEVPFRERGTDRTCCVYLAGPFFTTSELWLVTEAWRFLKDGGVPVFSPYHDVGRGPPAVVAPKDIAGIHKCSAMLALVDGCDPGTLYEVGYARALGIPVVALAENPKREDLTMLEGSGCEIFADFAAALYRVAAIA